MTGVEYMDETERHSSRTGNPSTDRGQTALARKEAPRSGRGVRCQPLVGETLEGSRPQGWGQGIDLQRLPAGTGIATERGPGGHVDRPRARRALECRLPQRLVDVWPRSTGHREPLRHQVSSGSCAENPSSVGAQLSNARTQGTRAERGQSSSLAAVQMARLKKGARERKLALVFLDEFGMMLQPTRRRTWALEGHTPIQKVWARHDRLSGLGALSVTPVRHRLAFYVQLFRENIVTEDMVWFLMQMHWYFRRTVILIWDCWSVHQAATRYFQRHHPDWFQFEELPGYSPELNPVEQCWKHTKYDDLPNFIPEDLDQLYAEATRSLDSLRGDEAFLRSAFAYCKLPI